jgi:hypothetical protein
MSGKTWITITIAEAAIDLVKPDKNRPKIGLLVAGYHRFGIGAAFRSRLRQSVAIGHGRTRNGTGKHLTNN